MRRNILVGFLLVAAVACGGDIFGLGIRVNRLNGSSAYGPYTLPADIVTDALGRPAPFRIVGDKYITVSGTVPGTEEARAVTVSFTKPIAPSLLGNPLDVRNAQGTVVGHVYYSVSLTGLFSWRSE